MKSQEIILIAVAETSVIVRSGLVAVLKRLPDMNIQTIEVTSKEGLQHCMEAHTPNILIVNPQFEGWFDVDAFKEHYPHLETKIVSLICTFVDANQLKGYEESINLFDDVESLEKKISVLMNFAEEDAQIFSVEPYTKIKLGLDWVILREPFRNIRICNHQRKGFVICFGGTDQFFLTEKFVDYLQCKDRNVSIHVLATESFGIERLKKLEQCGVSPHLNASAIEVAHVLVESSCLIASASTITCEALACQTPIMCGYYVDNQRKMYDSLMRKRYVHGLGDLLDVSSIFLLECALKELNSKGNSLKKMQFNDLTDRYINLFQSL